MTIVKGAKTTEEAIAMVLDRKTGLTVADIEANLNALGVSYKKKDLKEVKASILIDAVSSQFVSSPAMDETSVAEEKQEEEVVMTNEERVEKELIAMTNQKNLRALENSKILKGNEDAFMMKKEVVPHVNPIVKEVRSYLKESVRRYEKNLGEIKVMVAGIEFFDKPMSYGRIGAMTVYVPRDYATISVWNQEEQKFEDKEFTEYDLNQFQLPKSFEPYAAGTGVLTLAIKEDNNGRLKVNLPKVKGKNNVYYDRMKTRDVRFGLANSANNRNLEAALTAFLQVFTGEFEQGNPENRHDLEPSCTTCRYATSLQAKDGVDDDLLMEDKNSRHVLQNLGTDVIGQYGNIQPNLYCSVLRKLVDEEAVEEANRASAMEKDYFIDEDGNHQWPSSNQVIIAGKPRNVSDIRKEGTKDLCLSCPFYHGNVFKGEARATKDRVEAKENGTFSTAFWTTPAMVNRQVVETLVVEGKAKTWVTKFPGEVEGPQAFRVKGIGVNVYGTNEIMAHADPEFVAPVEAFDEFKNEIMKKINQIFYAAFNLNKLDLEQAEYVFELALKKPLDLPQDLSTKWDRATGMLKQSLIWDEERTQNAARPDFTRHFFTSEQDGSEVIEVADVMGEKLYRKSEDVSNYQTMEELVESDSIDRNMYINNVYNDLSASEFARYLDEGAVDIVFAVIEEGMRFHLVGGDAKDRQLAADSLQHVLQRELNQFIYGVRRSVNPMEAIETLRVDEKVKAYLREVIGE